MGVTEIGNLREQRNRKETRQAKHTKRRSEDNEELPDKEINLIDPNNQAPAQCSVVTPEGQITVYNNFLVSGVDFRGRSSIVYCDLVDLYFGIKELMNIYEEGYDQASPEVQQRITAAILKEEKRREIQGTPKQNESEPAPVDPTP